MAMNKYMHPRNIYKKQPDFSSLAKKFPEFSAILKTDISGKPSIDFKDPKSLRVLTKCLLKSDFNIDVDIPENKLVPTLPLRLNYILWIEDLVNIVIKKNHINGLDIGTGACAIYPLLAAVKNKWNMVATETDNESFLKARENVERNNLKDLIKLIKIESASILAELFKTLDLCFDFCMCNPPFYSSYEELKESRNTSRPPPKNGFTGSPHELITEGGELEFCRRLIQESEQYKDKIMIFTTMIGHKCNLLELLEDLSSKTILHTHTDFCQGRVTRWGLAWTYQSYDLKKLVPPRNKTSHKKNMKITSLLPKLPNLNYDVQSTFKKLISLLDNLSIMYKTLNKTKNNALLDIVACKNTWSHQRRKRRLMKAQTEDPKRMKEDSESCRIKLDDTNEIGVETNQTINDSKVLNNAVHALLRIFHNDNGINLEMEYLDGTSGKDGIHQIIQYIKNNWHYFVIFYC